MSFDIVIPLGPNEICRINDQIKYTKKNVIGYRNIYIVTCNLNIKIDDCIIIDENNFPFKDFIMNYFKQHNGKKNRNGWYFQQLIKLYAGIYIDNILENYLIIDADVFFLKPIHFIENDKPIFATGTEYHIPYFTHMNLLHNNFSKNYNKSGICHHMLFNKKIINEIFTFVEEYHNKPFWQVFILSVNEHKKHNIDVIESGASEYELYFNYVLKNHKNDIIIRDLNWSNIQVSKFNNTNIVNLNYDFISVCAWFH
jgi:hypothetical protein